MAPRHRQSRRNKKCGICNNKFDKDSNKLICNGECKCRFHVNCVFASSTDFDGPNKNWKCEKCYDNTEQQFLGSETVNNSANSKCSEEVCCDNVMKIETKTEANHSHNALEHKEFQEKIITMADAQTHFLQMHQPPMCLSKAEYPFKWVCSLHCRYVLDCKIPDKLKDYKNQGPDYGFEKICFLLTLIFLNSWISKEESSDNSSDEEEITPDNVNEANELSEDEYSPEKAYILCRKALDEMAAHEGDVMYTRIGAALEHVVSATRAHMLFRRGDTVGSQIIQNSLKPVSEMTIEQKAGIEGIKGKFILSFYKDARKALEPSLNAKDMDPTFGAWYYQSGKIIRRLRREYKENMVKEEVEYFEKAVELERNPKYLVFLAQAYQEMAVFNPMSAEVDDLERKAALLYRESWFLQKDSATICRRIGNGMKNLRGKYQDINLSKKALGKSIEICPSKATFHQLGVLLYKYFKDDEGALACFQRVKDIYGTANEINLKLIRDPSYDPEDLIEYWKEISLPLAKRDLLYCDIGWYYLFFKNDLTMSVKYFWKVLRSGTNCFRVTEFESFPFCVRIPVNMIKVLVNEILLMKEKKIPPGENEDMAFLEAFLQDMYEKQPHMLEIKIDPNLKLDIKNDVDGLIIALRRKRYGYTAKKIPKESEGSWRKQESQPKDIVDDRFKRNWRSQDYKESDVASNRLMKYQEHESASYEPGSRRYQRAFMDGKSNSNNLNQQEGFSKSFENDRSDGAYRKNQERREHNRRQFTNNTRYDLTVTDWRSENKNGGS